MSPKIVILDGDESRCVNDVFWASTNGKKDLSARHFEANGSDFTLISAKSCAPLSDNHMLHFCANNREVFGENLSSFMPELAGAKDEFTYAGYVMGASLDEFESNPAYNSGIIASAIPVVREFLKDELAVLAEKSKAKIADYVFSKNPRYRAVLSHCGECDSIIPHTNDDSKLEVELFKWEQALKLKAKLEQSDLLSKGQAIIGNEDDSEALMKKLSDLGKGALADCIVLRKDLLETLAKCLERQDEGNLTCALEKSVYSLIFPLTANMGCNQHNLWIIDEKLAYQYYLASDRPISTCMDKEPDAEIFDPAFAFAGGLRNDITILEFIRPGRTDKECVDQALNYMSLILEGKCEDRHGRPFTESGINDIRFTCYIICDINADMKTFLEFRNFHRTPDGIGYCMHFHNFNAFFEIMPYSNLMNDAIMRNNTAFEQIFSSSSL
jgi:hypothetical protein